jgi:predicted transcriptional regulator
MLTPLELDIMKAIWRDPPITVRGVQEAIRPTRPLAYTTVMTLMDRLYHKGFLTRTMQSRTHYYKPAIDFGDVRDQAVDALIRNFFGSKEKLKEFLDGAGNDFMPTPAQRPPVPDTLDETLL